MYTCTFLSEENHTTSKGMGVANLIINAWPLAGKVGEEKLGSSYFLQNAPCYHIFVLDIVRSQCFDAEGIETPLDGIT